jgi:hypothetical protein
VPAKRKRSGLTGSQRVSELVAEEDTRADRLRDNLKREALASIAMQQAGGGDCCARAFFSRAS